MSAKVAGPRDDETIMQIRDYQRWLDDWDRARGWDRVAASHTLIHAMEELGEVARLVLQWEGWREAGPPEKLRADLAEELSDLLMLLFKLASAMGVDVETALARGQDKVEHRHGDLERAGAELARYHERQAALLAEITKGRR